MQIVVNGKPMPELTREIMKVARRSWFGGVEDLTYITKLPFYMSFSYGKYDPEKKRDVHYLKFVSTKKKFPDLPDQYYETEVINSMSSCFENDQPILVKQKLIDNRPIYTAIVYEYPVHEIHHPEKLVASKWSLFKVLEYKKEPARVEVKPDYHKVCRLIVKAMKELFNK
jgi:hypothetical protein